MAENDNKSVRVMKSEISTLTPLEKEVIGSSVRGNGNLPDKMEGEEYDKLLQEVNQERETVANNKKEGTKITVKGSHGKVLNLIPSDDPVKNRIVETLKDCLVFHNAKSVDDVLDKTKDFYEMKVWNRLNKNLWEIAYRKNNTDIRLNISSSGDLSKIKVVEHERRYYGQSDIDESVGDFDLKALDDIELSKVDVSLDEIKSYLDTQMQELADAKAKLVKVLDSARADLGDTILIQPTTVKLAGIDTTVKAIFLAPDSKGGGEFRLAGEDYAVLAVGEGKHTEFNIEKILEDTKSIAAITAAVKETLNHRPRIKTRQDLPESDIRSAEYAAKQAVHERIVIPSARSFTQQQLDALEHYRAMFTTDTSTGELFTRLYEDVIKDQDVARKPEKWQTDTLKELNDFAEGITSEQSQGLKRSY